MSLVQNKMWNHWPGKLIQLIPHFRLLYGYDGKMPRRHFLRSVRALLSSCAVTEITSIKVRLLRSWKLRELRSVVSLESWLSYSHGNVPLYDHGVDASLIVPSLLNEISSNMPLALPFGTPRIFKILPRARHENSANFVAVSLIFCTISRIYRV